jgi:protein-S-isoprenylcysteine O-methyltransferase Ste14/rhodanese-related sulfurtransferase
MGGVFVLGPGTQNSHVLLERFEESRLAPAFFCLAAVGVVLATAWDTGFSHRGWNALQLILIVLLSIPAAFLLIASLIGLISYFIFLPSISQDSHLFLRAHASHLIHPLKTAIVLGLAAFCVFTRSQAGWAIWIVLLMIHAFQTFLIIRRARREHPISEPTGSSDGTLQLLLNLVLGTEIVTAASGVKGLPAWRLDTMSEDTWMIDVRTKAEFHWNRLRGAENYPWGKGIIEAAQGKSKELPVLIICLTGHRSPSVAVTLQKLGFKSVYHLTWGLLYLLLLERDGKKEGPFSFEKSHGNLSKRDEELKGISIGYGTLGALMLIVAPLELIIRKVHMSGVQMVFGALIGLSGLTVATLSYRALGKNFRVYAAPKRNGKLITSGVYSKVRHPMYTGAILMMGGWILFFGSLWGASLWLAFSILYIIKSIKEERILAAHFPEYGGYRKRTWKFLPYIY